MHRTCMNGANFSALPMLLPTCQSCQFVRTFNLVLVGQVCHGIVLASTQAWNLAKMCTIFFGLGYIGQELTQKLTFMFNLPNLG